jgi:stearoyl-CoA desaturase (delta-9 desaturase)
LLYAWIYVAQMAVFFLAGLGAGWLISGQLAEGFRLGLSLVVWGVLVRTVLVWHVTWSVNSLTHLWGYRNHETGENSRNNWLVGYLAAGEGWHNNHHAFPRSARHGLAWWEIDVTYATIRLLERMGLAWDIVEPPTKHIRSAAAVESPVPAQSHA